MCHMQLSGSFRCMKGHKNATASGRQNKRLALPLQQLDPRSFYIYIEVSSKRDYQEP